MLEQKNPLVFPTLPGKKEIGTNHGCIGFMEESAGEDSANPVFQGLTDKDFCCWAGDNWLYRDAYGKPASGGKSLLQCEYRLTDSTLVQMQSGKGLLLLSQLLIEEKINASAAAQTLLLNLLHY